MQKLVKLRGSLIAFSTVLVMGFGLTGSVGASAVASISDTGSDSYNKISLENKLNISLDNENNVHIVNNNQQTAKTGDATVAHNTNGGSALTGDATNSSEFRSSVNIDNETDLKALMGGSGGLEAQIENTGPDSVNKIEFNNNLDCRVTNYNNISAINNNPQTAETGDASVGGEGWMFNWNNWSPENWKSNGSDFDNWYNNFGKWLKDGTKPWDTQGTNNSWKAGDSWSDNNPLVWKSNGQNYDQWKTGIDSYMNKHRDEWKNSWGNANGGDATSGNAMNYSTADFNVNISNKNHCVSAVKPTHNPGVPGQPGQGAFIPENFSQPTPVQGGFGAGTSEGNFGGEGSFSEGQVGGFGAGPSANQPGPQPFNPGKGGGEGTKNKGDSFTISNTGPDSYNKISMKNDTSVCITNDNNVSITNNNSQNASSGNATVSGNTNGGDSMSGYASNYSSVSADVTIKN